MSEIWERIESAGIVPVVVIENADDAVKSADALDKAGIGVMEITLRTPAGLDAIRRVAEQRPNILVGAGTVRTLDQCKKSVQAGAGFIVSPGLERDIVAWCMEQGVAVIPGCVTPTEIMAAAELGCGMLKFFPANVYGGLAGLKALAGPFPEMRFIPTGGVDTQNVGQFITHPSVLAVGGSWVCKKADISKGNFETITDLAQKAVQAALGFELAHAGVHAEDAAAAGTAARRLSDAFGFSCREGRSSFFAGDIEIVKGAPLGSAGHIAVRTNSIPMARAWLERRGYETDPETAKYEGKTLKAVYLKDLFGGFAVHLLQK